MRILSALFLLLLAGCNLQSQPSAAPTATRQPISDDHLVVAWVESGNLIVWQTGDTFPRRIASGGVVRPFIAPDGQHIAYTRGAAAAPETLWTADITGTAEQQLVGERPAGYIPGEMQIGDVVWLDNSTIYFNTVRQSVPAFTPANDLYRADIHTREIIPILATGEGGRMFPSPDQQWIAIVYPGTYGEQNGRIALVDPLARGEVRDLLYFVGVATGAERSFYPDLYWLPDSSAVLTAIPPQDLIYDETGSDEQITVTTLWRLPVADPSEREIIGEVSASLFGQPRWSADGSHMTWLERIPNTNGFIAWLAAQDGSTAVELYRGDGGSIEQPQWIADSRAYSFMQIEETGPAVYRGEAGGQIERLSQDGLLALRFLATDVLVAIRQGDARIEMQAYFTDGLPRYIGSTAGTVPIFDAVLIRP